MAERVPAPRAAAAGGAKKRARSRRLGVVVGVDRRRRPARRRRARCRTRPPAARRGRASRCRRVPSITSGRSSRSSRNDLLVVPPLDDDGGVRAARGAAGPAPRRGRGPQAMTLAIIESKSGGMTSPSATPVSTRTPGPAAGAAARSGRARARSRGRGPRRSAGPRWRGPNRRRRRPSSRPPAATCSCSLHQVEPGRHLGDRVLDLQPGVDLEERERPLLRLVEELDRARVAVAGGHGQPRGRVRELGSCSASSAGDADSSITFWLRRCTEQSRTPSAHAVPCRRR